MNGNLFCQEEGGGREEARAGVDSMLSFCEYPWSRHLDSVFQNNSLYQKSSAPQTPLRSSIFLQIKPRGLCSWGHTARTSQGKEAFCGLAVMLADMGMQGLRGRGESAECHLWVTSGTLAQGRKCRGGPGLAL